MDLRHPFFQKIRKWLFPTLLISIIFLSDSNLIAGGGPNVSGAKLYIQQNELDKASNVLLKEVNQVNAKNEDAWYLLGYVYARQKQYDKMVEAFNKALELKPKFKDKGIKISKDSGKQVHSQFGTELILKVVWGNAFNKGVKAFNDAINAPDDSARAVHYEQAVEGFRAAAMIMPDSTLAYRNMAAGLLNLGKPDESVEPLQEALKHNPDDSEVKTMLAQVYMQTEQDSLAIPVLEDLWGSGNRTVEVADYLSRAYIKAGKKKQAKTVYKEAIESNPDNFHFRYNYGTILLETNEYDQAIEQLSKAYAIDVELILAKGGVTSGMTAEEVIGVKGEPETKNITEMEGIKNEQWVYDDDFYVYVKDGLVTAVQYSVKKDDPAGEKFSTEQTGDINYNLGAAYLNRAVGKREALPEDSEDKAYMEDFELALPYLERSVKMNPDDEGIWFSLGRIAGQLNKMALAGYAFSKGEPTKSALNDNVRVGMPTSSLKSILGEPDKIKPIESEQLLGIEEWIYNERARAQGKIAITDPVNIYVTNGHVDALLVNK